LLVRQRRGAARLTQEQLSERSGLSVRAISDIERGIGRPRRSSLVLLASALGLDASECNSLLAAAGQRPEPANPVPGAAAPTQNNAVAAGDRLSAVPHQLPSITPHFAGRAAELMMLTRQLEDAVAARGTVVITAIGGMAGVGKSALAVHWAHEVVEQFPDGQLYVNLRGFGPGHDTVGPEQAIRGFLEALQVPPGKIPVNPHAQAGLYRTLLAGKRMLIVLDNARDEDQVRPLLPAGPSCLTVVTSRRQMLGLVAADAAHLVSLDVLSEAEARELLARRLGTGPVAAEPDVVTDLIALCGRLPLALAITAARAAAYPTRPLAGLARELREQRGRLAALDLGEPATSVRAVFSWSCQNLDSAAARVFRLLSLHPGHDVTIPAAASLASVSVEESRDLLRELVRASLLSEHAPGRFVCHDLLRVYASEQACAKSSEQERRSAFLGLSGYYFAAASAAMDVLFPAEKHRRPQSPAPALALPSVPTLDAGRDWLDTERANIVAVIAYAAANGWPDHAIQLAMILYRYLEAGGHNADAENAYACALQAARQTGDLTAQADSLRCLGTVCVWQGRHQQAFDKLSSAQEIYRAIGDRLGQARTLNTMGSIDWWQGRQQQAADRIRQALAIYRAIGERLYASIALNNLGLVVQQQGHYESAVGHHKEALADFREIGDRHGEAQALNGLGMALRRLGRYPQAEDHLARALVMFRELGRRHGEADALQNIGGVLQDQARYQLAAEHYRQALVIIREMGDPLSEAQALNGLGEALCGSGALKMARAHHSYALTLADQVGGRFERARAHDGLGHSFHRAGDHAQARHHWQQALACYADLSVPEATDVSARLLALPPSSY
jgi:tetratricopeptide (TPR) repeat protein/transcriptional regulator with XRE-family HTH domain